MTEDEAKEKTCWLSMANNPKPCLGTKCFAGRAWTSTVWKGPPPNAIATTQEHFCCDGIPETTINV
jgi:hypothetical protein